MEGKEIGKGFIVGLVIFIVLNLVLRIAYYAVDDVLDLYMEALADNPILLVDLLFGSMIVTPGYGLSAIIVGAELEYIILGMSIIVPGIIAALVIGLVANEKYERFIAWLIVALVCFVIIVIAGVLDEVLYLPSDFETFMQAALIGLLVNIAFDGFFAIILPEK